MHNIPFWKIIVSWIYPLHIESFETNKNSSLDVVLQYGQLVVDTKTANFSFGNLHLIFQEAIELSKLAKNKNYNTLILGFGAGSISEILQYKNIQHNITGVEYDKAIIEIAKKYFPFVFNNATIIIEDAYKFIKENTETFDLVFIDLFYDTNVPEKFQKVEFLENVKKSLKNNSILLMNTMNEPKELFENWEKVFGNFNFYSIQENKVLHL